MCQTIGLSIDHAPLNFSEHPEFECQNFRTDTKPLPNFAAVNKMLAWSVLMFMQSVIWVNEPVTVSGRVLSPDGNPVAFAQIVLVAEPPFSKGEVVNLRTRCDAQGQFRFQLPRPMDMSAFIIAFQEGYGISWAKVALVSSSQCVVRLTKRATLSGTLQPCEGKTRLTIKGLRPLGLFDSHFPTLRLKEIGLDFLQTQTDADGKFAFGNLPDRCIAVLEVSEPPCQFEVPVEEGLKILLPNKSVIVGKVVWGNGDKPLPNVQVVLQPVSNLQAGQQLSAIPKLVRTISDEKGQFKAVVSEGEWIVWLPAKGDADWVSVPQLVKVKSGEVTSVLIRAQRPGVVRGWVADAEIRFPNPRLFVVAKLLSPLLQLPIRMEIFSEVAQQLPEGAYELRLPDGLWELKVADEGWESESIVAEIVEGAVLEAPWIFVRRFPSVNVFVTDEKGNQTKAILADSLGKFGETDEKGFARWQIPPNQIVRLFASSLDRNFWAFEMLTGKMKEVRLRLTKGVKIAGVVLDISGQPQAGALVSVWAKLKFDEPEVCLLSQRSDEKGRFHFTVPPQALVQLKAQKGTKIAQTSWVWSQSFDFVELVLE